MHATTYRVLMSENKGLGLWLLPNLIDSAMRTGGGLNSRPTPYQGGLSEPVSSGGRVGGLSDLVREPQWGGL
jgi:hypothetical protein